jgi:hypothetical protein
MPYSAQEYARFRDRDLQVSAADFATAGRVKALKVLVARHPTEVRQVWFQVLDALPETTSPMDYASLLPCGPWLPSIGSDGLAENAPSPAGSAGAGAAGFTLPTHAPVGDASGVVSGVPGLCTLNAAVEWFCIQARRLDSAAGQLQHARLMASLGLERVQGQYNQPPATSGVAGYTSGSAIGSASLVSGYLDGVSVKDGSTAPADLASAPTMAASTCPGSAVDSSCSDTGAQLVGGLEGQPLQERVPWKREAAAPLVALLQVLSELEALVYDGVVPVDVSLDQWEHMALRVRLHYVMQEPSVDTISLRVRCALPARVRDGKPAPKPRKPHRRVLVACLAPSLMPPHTHTHLRCLRRPAAYPVRSHRGGSRWRPRGVRCTAAGVLGGHREGALR